MPGLTISAITQVIDDRYNMDHSTNHNGDAFYPMPGGIPGVMLINDDGDSTVVVYYGGRRMARLEWDCPLDAAVILVERLLQVQADDEIARDAAAVTS